MATSLYFMLRHKAAALRREGILIRVRMKALQTNRRCVGECCITVLHCIWKKKGRHSSDTALASAGQAPALAQQRAAYHLIASESGGPLSAPPQSKYMKPSSSCHPAPRQPEYTQRVFQLLSWNTWLLSTRRYHQHFLKQLLWDQNSETNPCTTPQA